MIRRQSRFIRGFILAMWADRPTQTPTDWCAEHLRFDEPDNRGPYSTLGREYIREPVDTFADPTITDQILVFGSQTGKTGAIMGGAAWTLRHEPARIFWVMPTQQTVIGFSRTRWMKFIAASPTLAELIPTGAHRHDWATQQQQIGGSIIDMVWSNSPAALSSVPARVVILDEVDKFSEGTAREANAVSLAEQRTKNFGLPKRIKTSTPTLTDGPIWQEFQKTDQRRRFVPCPHCGKFVLLIWSKEYTILPITGAEAFIAWDKEAKLADGRWDLDRVERSAHALCPHCAGRITDAHKTMMDRGGEWRPTVPAARGYRGWHLSSLYACRPECNFGRLAVKFLQAKTGLQGLQGFINGDLAEPWENQESRSERTEIIVRGQENDTPIGKTPIPLLTVDVQAVSPYFWLIVREWTKEGHSRLRYAGHWDDWEDINRVQLEHKVEDHHVLIDSGDQTQTVYANCLRHGKIIAVFNSLPVHRGWMPAKGRDKDTRWTDPKTKQPQPWYLGSAALPHRKFRMPLLEFNGEQLLEVLSKLRKGPQAGGGFRWEVTDKVSEEYWRHLDAKIKKPLAVGRTGRVEMRWCLRSQRWPDHLLDCELMQLAFAIFHKLFPWAE